MSSLHVENLLRRALLYLLQVIPIFGDTSYFGKSYIKRHIIDFNIDLPICVQRLVEVMFVKRRVCDLQELRHRQDYLTPYLNRGEPR